MNCTIGSFYIQLVLKVLVSIYNQFLKLIVSIIGELHGGV